YVSGMSFGSLSGRAVEALNRGAALCGCLHNTGEGGISPYHRHGGELIWQLGTAYFGARTPEGRFDLDACVRQVEEHPVRAIEIKLSQGAKPGLGGVLPAPKVTAEIASIRGVPRGRTVISPPGHVEFSNADELLDFVERIADATGLPVGIKSAVGLLGFWIELAELMAAGDRGVDFITVDGGEGGTGAAPFSFSDHVALPFKIGFSRVYRIFAERGQHKRVVWVGSGKLGFPHNALLAFCLGADMVAVGREAMMAIGCIQAQRCHTGRCPTGVATQNRWLMRGLDPTSKAARLANYVVTLRKELTRLAHACGVEHPALLTPKHMEILDGAFGSRPLLDVFGYEEAWTLPSVEEKAAVLSAMASRNGDVRVAPVATP
ncbi:MAG TPA: FMN-binding glutamate synthase family protein, partial [Longimicrobiales bacterium]|nr:FMN-binding glutamate synthase family protein [Longimicrobiales bacterium]